MPDFISPEPSRAMFDSEAAYSQAWMDWAEATPGGWRARLADRADEDGPGRTRRIPVEWLDGPDPTEPDPGPARTEPEQALSPCCQAGVLADPLSARAGKGLCSTCATLVHRMGGGWEIRTGGIA